MKSLPQLLPPSREFLAELLERARRSGWAHDYIEIGDFVQSLHREAGIELTDAEIEPYPIDPETDEPAQP